MSNEGAGAMSGERKEKSVLEPRRRFPEFRNAGEWTTPKLEDISVPVEERVGDRKLVPVSISAGIGFVPQAEKFGRDISGNQYRLYTVVRDGDFVYNKGNSLKFPQGCVYDLQGWGEVAAPNVFICFRLKAGYENGFFRQCFEQNAHGWQLKKHITSGARSNGLLNISRDAFFGVKIPTPRHPEQQKIADCLSSLDELITAETQRLDALKTRKKGLMQQLFPRGGETVPRLRFPEFLEAGEWEEKLIEDFFDVGSSKRVLQQDWTTQGVPFYRTRELVSLSKNEPFGSEIFISEELFREISEKYGLPAEGDFLVSGVGTLGISYQVQAQDRFYFKDGNVLWFKLRGGIVSTFFKYCFEADEIQNQILAQASISTVGTYTIQNAKVTKFSCPTDIEEQQKIADCLSSLDDLITAQSQKIDALKTHKKGLMQQLFPALDDVPT